MIMPATAAARTASGAGWRTRKSPAPRGGTVRRACAITSPSLSARTRSADGLSGTSLPSRKSCLILFTSALSPPKRSTTVSRSAGWGISGARNGLSLRGCTRRLLTGTPTTLCRRKSRAGNGRTPGGISVCSLGW